MKLVIKPLKTAPVQTPAEEYRDTSRPVLGPGGIYEGVISTYREDASAALQRNHNTLHAERTTATHDASHPWEPSQVSTVGDGLSGAWRDNFVQKTFRDAPDWIRNLILSSCVKSNLFKDSATSPRLESLSKLFGEAELKQSSRSYDFGTSMPFPPALSTCPTFDESENVHADEKEFVDCVLKRILDVAIKRYRFARIALRNLRCKQLQDLKCEDMERVLNAIREASSMHQDSSVSGSRAACQSHILHIPDMSSVELFALQDELHVLSNNLSKVIQDGELDKVSDVTPWQLQALDEMERAHLETIQLERCRWTMRLEDETKSLRWEYELWSVKGEVDSVVRYIVDFEKGRIDDSFPSGTDSELKPFLSTGSGSIIDLVDLQRSLLQRLISKFEQDHEISSHPANVLDLLRNLFGSSMDHDQRPNDSGLHQALVKSIEVLQEGICNALANMFLDDGGEDDSNEFMQRTEYLQEGVRELSLVLVVQEMRWHLNGDATSTLLESEKGKLSKVHLHLNEALSRILKTIEKEIRSGNANLDNIVPLLRKIREDVENVRTDSKRAINSALDNLNLMLNSLNAESDRCGPSICMLKTAVKMLQTERCSKFLLDCRYSFRVDTLTVGCHDSITSFGAVIVQILAQMNVQDFCLSDSRIQAFHSQIDHVAFWRWLTQIMVEKNVSFKRAVRAAVNCARIPSLQRRFMDCRRFEYGGDNHLRKLQDEMRSIVSSIDLSATRGGDHSAYEIRSSLAVLQLQLNQLLLTQPKSQSVNLMNEPTDLREFAQDALCRRDWIAKFHNGIVSCLLRNAGTVGKRVSESVMLTELITNLWVDCFKQVGKKDEIERGGWMAVSSVEASHGGIRIDPSICSQLLYASYFSNVSFSHALLGRTNQFKNSMEIFRILLANLISRGLVHTSWGQIRKFLDWAVEQALESSTTDVPLLQWQDGLSPEDEDKLNSRLSSLPSDFPFPHLLLKMLKDLDFIGNYKFPEFAVRVGNELKLRYVARVLSKNDETEWRNDHQYFIHCDRYRSELAFFDKASLDSRWSDDRLLSDSSVLDHLVHSDSNSFESVFIPTTKDIDIAAQFASIFQEIALIDVSSRHNDLKDLTQLKLPTVSDQDAYLIQAHRSQQVLLFKEAQLSKVFRMRIPKGCCKVWPASHNEADKNLFPPPEDFEGRNFDDKFERHPRPIGAVKDGVDLLKWKGGMEERWYLLKRAKPHWQLQKDSDTDASARMQLRKSWVASESARVLFSDSRPSKEQSIPVLTLPCRLYEFTMSFDEDDYCDDTLWEGSVLLFALEIGDFKVPCDVGFLKDIDEKCERESEIFCKISCEDLSRLAIVDSLLGAHGLKFDDFQPVTESSSPKAFFFRMPTSWDSALGGTSGKWNTRGDLSDFHEASSALRLIEDFCKNPQNHFRQKVGWFDQGDRGRQALVKYVKDICGDCTRAEFDSSRSKKLLKVMSFMRLLDSSATPTPESTTFEDAFRSRARLLAFLVSKIERREVDSDLLYFSEAVKSVLKEEQSFRLALLHADPLPSNLDQGRPTHDYEHAETAMCANAVEHLCHDQLQGINCNVQVATIESIRSSILCHDVIQITSRACVSNDGALQLLLERRQREGVDRMNLGVEKVTVDSDMWNSIQPEPTSKLIESTGSRLIVLQLFFDSGQRFKILDFNKAFHSFLSAGDSKFCFIIVDADHAESNIFLRHFYDSLKKGETCEGAMKAAAASTQMAHFVFPSDSSTSRFFPIASKVAPWRVTRTQWKSVNIEDRSKPSQVEIPSLISRLDWVGSNFSFCRNEELCKQLSAMDNSSRILVHGAQYEDICASAYELFRFCSQRSWKGKVFLTRIEGVQGESMTKKDVVRGMCRENEDEQVLFGEDVKRSAQGARNERRYSDDMLVADDDPYDDLSAMVRQSGVELYIVVDGTGLNGSKHTKLAEFLGFVGDQRCCISFAERQKVVLFACRPLKGFQGPEVRLEPLGIPSHAAKDFFGRTWKKLREDESDLRKLKSSEKDRGSELESALVIFNNVSGENVSLERAVARSLARFNVKDLFKFSQWIQERSDALAADNIIAFLFDILRPEEQGAFLSLTVFVSRFDSSILPKILGRWEECMEIGYRAVLHRPGQSADDEHELRRKIQWAQEVSKGLVEGVNPDTKKAGSNSASNFKQHLFPDVVVEKLVRVGIVSKIADAARKNDDRQQFLLPEHVQRWGRQKISEVARICPQFFDIFQQRRGVVAEYISEKLLESGRQSVTSLNSAWDVHQHDWLRSVNFLKDSDDPADICQLAKLLWSVTLGNSWNMVFSRVPRALLKSFAERSVALKGDLLETASVVAFAKLEYIRGCTDLDQKDKEACENVVKVLEAALDALEQNWSALAPFSVDFNNNVLDYYMCKAEILNTQGLVRSWIRKDPKEKDAIRLYDDAVLSCFGGRPATDDEHILHKVLLLKIQNNRGNSLRSVGYRELKHYQKKELGKRKRGALEEVYNYFKQAEDCFEKAKELCFRQNVYNRNQQFGEKYHDIQVSKAYHNLALCKLGLAKTIRQMEEDSPESEEGCGMAVSCSDLLRDAQVNADRALGARCKWGQRGNLSLQIEALSSRVVLCNILYELRSNDREPDWREVVSRTRRMLIDDIAVLKERKRSDLMTHSQRSALRSARRDADKVLGMHRELFQEEGMHMEESGEEDDGRTPTNRRRGSRDRSGADRNRDREVSERGPAAEPDNSAGGSGGFNGGESVSGGGDRGDAGWGGWVEPTASSSQPPRSEGGGWGGWVEGAGGGGAGPSGERGGEGRDAGPGRGKGPFFHVPVGERRYRKQDKSDPSQPSPAAAQGSHGGSGSPPPGSLEQARDSARDGGWRDDRRESGGGRDSWRDSDRRDSGGGGGAGRKDPGPANRIFAGGMRSQRPPNMLVTPDMVREVFSRFGKIVDMRAGAKDFVFIDYEDIESCYKAVEGMNGKSFDEHSRGVMKVSVARPFAPQPRRRSRSRDGRPQRPGGRSRSRSWSRDRGPYRSRSRSPADGPPRRSRSPRDGPPRSRSPMRDGPWSRSPPPRDGPTRSWSRSPPRGDGGGRPWRGDGPPPDRDGPWRGGGRGRGGPRGGGRGGGWGGGSPPGGGFGRDGPWRGEGRGGGGGPDWAGRDGGRGRDGGDFRDGPPGGGGFRDRDGYRDGPPRDWGRDGPPPRDWGRDGGFRDGPPGDGYRDGPPPRGGPRDGPPPPRYRDGGPPPRDGDGSPWGGPRDRRDAGPGGRDGPPHHARREGSNSRSPSRGPPPTRGRPSEPAHGGGGVETEDGEATPRVHGGADAAEPTRGGNGGGARALGGDAEDVDMETS